MYMIINDENGELKKEIDDVKLRWKEYIDDLYSKNEKPRIQDFDMEEECLHSCLQMLNNFYIMLQLLVLKKPG